MATINPGPNRQQLAADHSTVRHPLGALRSYIRAYVGLEGVGFFLTFLFVWFWIGLLLDFGFLFKLLGIDYTQSLPSSSTAGRIFRVGILGGLTAWLITKLLFVVVVRLFRDFSDSSLALLLERRYPDELGDRLITAVELADPEKAAMQGYSVVMVQETIHEAASRVQKLPVKDVFDWGRLVRAGVVVLLLSVVAYFAAVGLFHSFRLYQPNRGDLNGFNRFHDVASIWVQRNILLQDTPWPREQQLVALAPTTDTVRLGYNLGRTTVKYRALKYVVADSNDPEGWRPLLLKDLKDQRIKLVEGDVPELPLDWKGKYHPEGELSLDEIELAYERLPVRLDAPDSESTWSIRELREGGVTGYRPVTWSDLRANSQFGVKIPRLDAGWDPKAIAALFGAGAGLSELTAITAATNIGVSGETASPTVDTALAALQALEKLEADKKIDNKEITQVLLPDVRAVYGRLQRFDEMRDLVERVNTYLNQPALSQVARVLTLPEQADLVSTLKNSDTRVTLSRSRDTNEFTGTIDLPSRSDLITYYLRTDALSTPVRRIEVIGPPQLLHLYSEESRPAYLFYRWRERDSKGQYLSDVKPEDLVGLKQVIDGEDKLNAGGPVSRVEVPAGTELKLRAEPERSLKTIRLVQGKGPKLPDNIEVSGPDDSNQFTITFPNLRTDLIFALELVDQDDVVGTRNVIIKVLEDVAPDLPEMKPSAILRKNKEGQFLVTPDARIPFDGQVLDDHGLSGIRYAYTVERVELVPNLNTNVLGLYLSAFATGGIRGQLPFNAVPLYLEALAQNATSEAERIANVKVFRFDTLPGLRQAILNSTVETEPYLSLADIKDLLEKPQRLPYRRMVNKYDVVPDPFKEGEGRTTPEKNDFAVRDVRFENQPLKVLGENRFQPRYKLQIWVEALDNDIESARDRSGSPTPHLSSSKDRFSFLVVDEYELLLEISKSEEALNYRLIQLSRGVDGGKSWEHDSLSKMESDLGTDLVQLAGANIKNAEVRQMAARIRNMKSLMAKGQTYCQDVLSEYRLLIHEMELNRVEDDKIRTKRRDVVDPLGKVINSSFPRAEAALDAFDKSLLQSSQGEPTSGPAPAGLAAAKAQSLIAQTALRDLHNDLETVIQALEQVANLAKEVEKLKRLAEKKQGETELYERVKKAIEERELRELENLLNPGGTPPKP